jgi:hypothetical protein
MDLKIFVGIVVAILLLTVGSVSGATITVDDSCSADNLSIQASSSSETGADMLYIRGSVFNGSDITNNDMGYIGNNENGILEINTSNFAGFYYDLNSNIGTENFEILQNLTESYRTINKNGLVYTTSIMNVDYEQTLWTDQYQKICYFGEEYVPIKLNAANKLSNLLMDEKVSRTLRTSKSLPMAQPILGHMIRTLVVKLMSRLLEYMLM